MSVTWTLVSLQGSFFSVQNICVGSQ